MDTPFSAAVSGPSTVTPGRRDLLRATAAVALAGLLGTQRQAWAAAADASDADARLLPGFRVEKVQTSGATLHTVIGGKGPPLLLIHGRH